jgi:hypothetical protein
MNRTIKKQFWLNKYEVQKLEDKSRKACLSEAALVRYLIQGYEPKCEPSDKFYVALGNLIIAKKRAEIILKMLEFDKSDAALQMKSLLHMLEQVEADMEESVLVPNKLEEKWR